MHQALQIQEILLNIFGHCCISTSESATSDLPGLARTCRAFKEPALDVLWEELIDPSPLARCLPQASHHSQVDECYSFSRSLTQVEWGILRSYTRRIRSILDDNDTLNWESVSAFLGPPTTEPLFPNLRHLYTGQLTEIKIKHLLCMPFPSLTSLRAEFMEENQDVLQGPLEWLSKFSPNIKRLAIEMPRWPDVRFTNFFAGYICRWRDLHTVDCGFIALDVDAIAHLSRMPALSWLSCTPPSATLPPSDSPILFPNLHYLTLYSDFLDPISRTLSRVRLPAITNFIAYPYSRPSKQGLSSFSASVQTSVIGHTIRVLWVQERHGVQDGDDPRPVLGFEDLQPCMTFSDLHCLYLDLSWDVRLTDSDLLALASAWPHLEHLNINTHWGWNTLGAGGITPNGLIQLLQTCQSLNDIGLTIDTRDFTEFRESPGRLGLMLPPAFSINVLDSFIEEGSVPAIAAFLASIAPYPNFSFRAYKSWWFTSERTDHEDRWYEAYRQANVILGRRSSGNLQRSFLSFFARFVTPVVEKRKKLKSTVLRRFFCSF